MVIMLDSSIQFVSFSILTTCIQLFAPGTPMEFVTPRISGFCNSSSLNIGALALKLVSCISRIIICSMSNPRSLFFK